jgi:hypothetical protein
MKTNHMRNTLRMLFDKRRIHTHADFAHKWITDLWSNQFDIFVIFVMVF